MPPFYKDLKPPQPLVAVWCDYKVTLGVLSKASCSDLAAPECYGLGLAQKPRVLRSILAQANTERCISCIGVRRTQRRAPFSPCSCSCSDWNTSTFGTGIRGRHERSGATTTEGQIPLGRPKSPASYPCNEQAYPCVRLRLLLCNPPLFAKQGLAEPHSEENSITIRQNNMMLFPTASIEKGELYQFCGIFTSFAAAP